MSFIPSFNEQEQKWIFYNLIKEITFGPFFDTEDEINYFFYNYNGNILYLGTKLGEIWGISN